MSGVDKMQNSEAPGLRSHRLVSAISGLQVVIILCIGLLSRVNTIHFEPLGEQSLTQFHCYWECR